MSWSYLPRWKFTDSCGRPRALGTIHVGCAHSEHTQCAHTSRRAFLKGGIAIVGGGGMATVVDPGEVFAQVRVFPPPPPAVSPIAGLMDTHVHAAPDVFGRSLDDEEVAILYKDRGLEAPQESRPAHGRPRLVRTQARRWPEGVRRGRP